MKGEFEMEENGNEKNGYLKYTPQQLYHGAFFDISLITGYFYVLNESGGRMEGYSYRNICYSARRSYEDFLRGYLVYNNVKIGAFHNLKYLWKKLIKIDPDFHKIKEQCYRLDKHNGKLIYPPLLDRALNDVVCALKALMELYGMPQIQSLLDKLKNSNDKPELPDVTEDLEMIRKVIDAAEQSEETSLMRIVSGLYGCKSVENKIREEEIMNAWDREIFKEMDNMIIHCGYGWFGLIMPIVNDIQKYNKNKKSDDSHMIASFDEEQGVLEIGISKEPGERLKEKIFKAMKASKSVCEYCGCTGGLYEFSKGWLKTLCPECAEKELANIENIRRKSEIQKPGKSFKQLDQEGNPGSPKVIINIVEMSGDEYREKHAIEFPSDEEEEKYNKMLESLICYQQIEIKYASEADKERDDDDKEEDEDENDDDGYERENWG
jgi:hypothetical protein